MNSKLPALEDDVSSFTLAKNLAAMHSARQAYIQSESSKKIKQALKHRVRSCNEVQFHNGDKVYYKRKNCARWRGPGIVIGQEHKQILVKHGSELVRVHACSLVHANEVRYDSLSQDEVHAEVPTEDKEASEESDSDVSVDEGPTIVNEPAATNQNDQTDKEANKPPTASSSISLPKVNTNIAYRLKNDSTLKTGLIHSRAGKSTGRYKNCINVEDRETGNIDVLDFAKDIEEWDPVAEEVLITSNFDAASIAVAKEKELQSWKDNDVYTEVENIGQPVVTSRWVFSAKNVDGVIMPKARLVARGFEDDELRDRPTDSPTCTKESIRIAMSIIAIEGWACQSIDIKTAFLQGNQLERTVHMKPPREMKTDKLWKLHKCVYGLNEASRYWYTRVKEELINAEMTKSRYDDAVFYLKIDGVCHGILIIHVDDFLYGGSSKFEKIISRIRAVFTVGHESKIPLKYLGMDLSLKEEILVYDQQNYINGIEEQQIENKRDRERKLNKGEQSLFRAMCGQLNWIASQSRPDIAYDVCQLSTRLNSATVDDFLRANKVIRKVKQRNVVLMYQQLEQPIKLLGFCDASYANLKDGSSQGGFIIFLMGKDNKVSPLCWSSRKLRRVCRSTIAAETMALLDVSEACFWLQNVMNELLTTPLDTTVIYTDNKSLYQAAHSSSTIEEKRLRVELAGIRESINRREFKLMWIETRLQLADCLTKQGADSTRLLDVLQAGKI